MTMKPNKEEKKQDRKDEEPEEKEYPEGGTDGIIMRDGASGEKDYPLPDSSATIFTDPMDTARVELKTLREPPDVKIKSMNDVAILVRGMEDYDRERMKVIHLDTKNRVLHVENISTGTINSSIIHPREAVKGAVLSNATSVIIVHNHPSGISEPSEEDKQVAQVLVNAFDLMKIDVLDFVIVAKDWQYSFRDYEGLPRPQEPVVSTRVEPISLNIPPGAKIKSVDNVVVLLKDMVDYSNEGMKLIHLDEYDNVIGIENIGATVTSALLQLPELIKSAVKSNASSVVIVHNYPSGYAEPSLEYTQAAQEMVNAFNSVRIKVIDFAIIGKYSNLSYRTEGILPVPQEPVLEVLDSTIAEGGSEECQLAYRAAREVLEEQCGTNDRSTR